jgi:hypothetical protein
LVFVRSPRFDSRRHRRAADSAHPKTGIEEGPLAGPRQALRFLPSFTDTHDNETRRITSFRGGGVTAREQAARRLDRGSLELGNIGHISDEWVVAGHWFGRETAQIHRSTLRSTPVWEWIQGVDDMVFSLSFSAILDGEKGLTGDDERDFTGKMEWRTHPRDGSRVPSHDVTPPGLGWRRGVLGRASKDSLSGCVATLRRSVVFHSCASHCLILSPTCHVRSDDSRSGVPAPPGSP